jgi:hypothetical protein
MKPATRRQPARTAAAIIATAALVLLSAACSDSSSSTSSASSSAAGAAANSPLVAFSQCVRSRGVPDFPDPPPGATNAKFPGARQLRVSSALLSAAENACQHLLPAGVDDQFPAAEVPLLLTGMRQFSQCMRSHGVPNWPDPTIDSEGRPFFNVSAAGLSYQYTHSSLLDSKDLECERLVGGSAGVPVPLG